MDRIATHSPAWHSWGKLLIPALAAVGCVLESGWEDSGGGFRSVSDAYGAERVWEGDTCGVDGSSSLWIRLDF